MSNWNCSRCNENKAIVKMINRKVVCMMCMSDKEMFTPDKNARFETGDVLESRDPYEGEHKVLIVKVSDMGLHVSRGPGKHSSGNFEGESVEIISFSESKSMKLSNTTIN